MAVHTQHALSPSLSARVTEAVTLSPSLFRKRYKSFYETPSSLSSPTSSPTLPSWKKYRGTSELIADTKTECDESEAEGTNSESEEAALEDQQQQARGGDTVLSTYKVGQSSRSTPDQQLEITGETPTQTHARLSVRTTWKDPEDDTVYIDIECVYMDIECDIPLVHSPVQTSLIRQ
ncbi:hypothetical protein Tco_0224066 [Tanacetum coccineum]